MFQSRYLSFFLIIVFSLSTIHLYSQQEKKRVEAFRTAQEIKIDGELTEPDWKLAPPAKDFIQVEPYFGRSASQPTVVKLMYDNTALYIGAMLYDSAPDSILREFSVRDDMQNTDVFGIYIDPFNDAITAFGFGVTAAGVQIDIKQVGTNEDKSWDAVWKSDISITDSGWIVEMAIPYSALRFSKHGQQVWGLNMIREIRRLREISTWNPVDPKIAGFINQAGEFHGLSDIKPPIRLAFIPYVSGYLEKNPNTPQWGYSWRGGMDIKYGISESFTLDMILIPDFGQVESDDEVYNLSPFEIYYQEKRPFFMEGTELFDKGNVFYSRRIGGTPSGYDLVEDTLAQNELIQENPEETRLINSTKISGKTRKGLAIGYFNSITTNMYATVKDTITGSEREILTEPLTNYNMLVFEQSLKNNSFVSIFNTNVYSPKTGYVANVTGSDFRLNTRSNMYGVEGELMVSQKYNRPADPDLGYQYSIEGGKISGNFKVTAEHKVISDTYDPNDMGFLRRNNLIENTLDFDYDIYEPFWKLLRWFNSFYMNYNSLYRPFTFTDFSMGFQSRGTFKNHLTVGFNTSAYPVESHDYFEARQEGSVFIRPPSYSTRLFISPDYRKKFVVDVSASYYTATTFGTRGYSARLEPRIRISDKFIISDRIDYEITNNDIGYVDDAQDEFDKDLIIFGKRDINEIVNTFYTRYIFNNVSSLSFRFRYYWFKVLYNEYYNLLEDGHLEPYDYAGNEDFDYSAFTIDMVYDWQFAPGSELSIVWKNSIYTTRDIDLSTGYLESFKYTLESPATNSFSVKILYYIDYLYLKRKNKGK